MRIFTQKRRLPRNVVDGRCDLSREREREREKSKKKGNSTVSLQCSICQDNDVAMNESEEQSAEKEEFRQSKSKEARKQERNCRTRTQRVKLGEQVERVSSYGGKVHTQ